MPNTASRRQAELADRLKEIRNSLGLTQAELATRLSAERTVQAPTISTWENSRNPVRPPRERVSAYARLHVTAVRDGGAVLVPLHELTVSEQSAYEEEAAALFELYDGADQIQAPEIPKLWDFSDDEAVAIICPSAPLHSRGPLADPNNPNYTETHAFADLDALLVLYGHLQMMSAGRFPVTFHSADRYRIEDLSGHLVLLGGIGWNELSKLLQPSLTRLPVKQLEVSDLETGEIFEVVDNGKPRRFDPEWSDDNEKTLHRDVGYIARTRNPYNPHRTLTIFNGIHSRGVLGAVRSLTDVGFRAKNEAFIAERFGTGDFAILFHVPVVRGNAIGVALNDPEAVLYSWPPEEQEQ